LKEPPRCVRGRSRRLVPTGKSHNRHVKPESVHDGISTASERTSLTYTASYAVNSTRTEFSMLYDFLALLLDFYRLDLHRNPPRPSILAESTAIDLSQFGPLHFFACLGCACAGGLLHSHLYVPNSLDSYNNAFIPSPKFYKGLCECHWIVLDIEHHISVYLRI
jgi:hypothetical protein